MPAKRKVRVGARGKFGGLGPGDIQRLLAYWDQDARVHTLRAVPMKPVPGGSASWPFRVENLLGWTMGQVTVKMDWETDGCHILSCDWSLKDQWTAPTVGVVVDVKRSISKFPNSRCEDGMECCTFEISVIFEGYLNNIPYQNWYRICADGSTKWG